MPVDRQSCLHPSHFNQISITIRDRFMIHFIKPTIFIFTIFQLCALGQAQQDYRIDEVIEWNLQTVAVRKETNETLDGLNYREEKITVKKPVTEEMVRVDQNVVYKPVIIPNTVQANTTVPPARLSIPQRRLQWVPGSYRVDPNNGQTFFQRGALRWNTLSTNPPVFQPTQPNLPIYAYQPEVVETRTPVTVTRYVDETVTRRIPYEPQVVHETVEKLVAVKVRYQTPINSAGEPIGPTMRIVIPNDAAPAMKAPTPNPPTDEATFRASKNIEGNTKPNISVLKPKTPPSTTAGFTGVLKPISKSQSPVTSAKVESNFTETTPDNGVASNQSVETSSRQKNVSGSSVPDLESKMKSVLNK